jgi:hypothetical protein
MSEEVIPTGLRRDGTPDLRRREHNPMAGTGYPHQPKATRPPPLHHLKNLTEHRARRMIEGGQHGNH